MIENMMMKPNDCSLPCGGYFYHVCVVFWFFVIVPFYIMLMHVRHGVYMFVCFCVLFFFVCCVSSCVIIVVFFYLFVFVNIFFTQIEIVHFETDNLKKFRREIK